MSRLYASWIGILSIAAVFIAVAVAHSETVDALPFNKILRLAKAGNEEAQIAVARAYETGGGTGINKVEAAKWYRKAADQGNPDAMFRLARIASIGAEGVKKSPELASKLYESAARLGHAEAQNWLGYSYQHGIGIRQNDTSAVEWYRKAADSGLAGAQNNLGLMYLTGRGVQRDNTKAAILFEQAARQGDSWGINNLGGLYEMGLGVKQDRQKALAYYRQAFEKANKHAGENMKRLSAILGSSVPAASLAPPELQSIAEKEPPQSTAAPPLLATQAASAIEQAPAPRPASRKAAKSRISAKKQDPSMARPRGKKQQKASKESAPCGAVRFKNFSGRNMRLCDYF